MRREGLDAVDELGDSPRLDGLPVRRSCVVYEVRESLKRGRAAQNGIQGDRHRNATGEALESRRLAQRALNTAISLGFERRIAA